MFSATTRAYLVRGAQVEQIEAVKVFSFCLPQSMRLFQWRLLLEPPFEFVVLPLP